MHHKSANKKLKNVPTSGSNYARRMGIHSPPSGHPQNKRWVTFPDFSRHFFTL